MVKAHQKLETVPLYELQFVSLMTAATFGYA